MESAGLPAEIRALTSVQAEFGWLRIAASRHGICRVALEGEPAEWSGDDAEAQSLILEAARQLTAYLQGDRVHFDLPLDLSVGSEFQQAVWRATIEVPFGQVASYGDIARAVGNERAGRAVGQALKRNPLLILVPCHRVVRIKGGLGGFSAGEEVKLWLLKHEGVILL